MPTPDRTAAKEAHAHADALDRQILATWPDAWRQMDELRRNPPMEWPDWCLLPMAAAAAVATTVPVRPAPIAQIAMLNAWRYSRAIYLVEPALMDRLLTQIPDALDVEDLAGLPHWCVYVATGHPEFPGGGLWAHLEHDAQTGRPELRLVLDQGNDDYRAMLPIPVYLDRPSVTEALADMRATASGAAVGVMGGNVRGAAPDLASAQLAERVEKYLGLMAYLSRPEADIVCVDRPGLRPVRPRSPMRDRTVWAVGYSD